MSAWPGPFSHASRSRRGRVTGFSGRAVAARSSAAMTEARSASSGSEALGSDVEVLGIWASRAAKSMSVSEVVRVGASSVVVSFVAACASSAGDDDWSGVEGVVELDVVVELGVVELGVVELGVVELGVASEFGLSLPASA